MKTLLTILVTLAVSLLVPQAVIAAPVGSNPVTLHLEVADTISISVTPADLQFGKVSPGNTSGAQVVMITNNSSKAVNLTASAAPDFWANNLRIDDLPISTWGVSQVITMAIGANRNASMTVAVPAGAANGILDGSVTFWAE